MCRHKYKDPNRSALVDVHSPGPCVVDMWSGLAGVWMIKGWNRRCVFRRKALEHHPPSNCVVFTKKEERRSAATMDNIGRHVILRTQSSQKHNGQQSHNVFQKVVNTEISQTVVYCL